MYCDPGKQDLQIIMNPLKQVVLKQHAEKLQTILKLLNPISK